MHYGPYHRDMSIKLISVNIERSKHLDRVVPFLQKEQPDVLCLQELHERDIPRLASAIGATAIYAPMTRLPGEECPTGVAILTRHPVVSQRVSYYRGGAGQVAEFDDTSPETKYATESAMFVRADVDVSGDASYRIGTTHFTWTPDGRPDARQRADIAALIPIIAEAGELAFAGDFNAPRGGEIFDALASRWRDNIPSHYLWSLDLSLHRIGERMKEEARDAGYEGFMVDGLFTTPSYIASDVTLVSGVSDHRAIVAYLTRV